MTEKKRKSSLVRKLENALADLRWDFRYTTWKLASTRSLWRYDNPPAWLSNAVDIAKAMSPDDTRKFFIVLTKAAENSLNLEIKEFVRPTLPQ